MRYKIGFEFPFFDQKHLQHAHSHFAFTGWITHTLYVLMSVYISHYINEAALKKYRYMVIVNIISAYSMLISFAIQGYGMVSITFSTLSVLVSYLFAFYYISDLKHCDAGDTSPKWFRAALIFNVISSIGTFFLAWMMATKNIHQNSYLASVYFFLHFQYNGWFFFACMGLFSGWLYQYKVTITSEKIIFYLFVSACIPAYFLSALWLVIPVWLYVVVVIAASMQVYAWFMFLQAAWRSRMQIKSSINVFTKNLLLLVCAALTIKLLLQLGSTLPALSKLAFGFRPIVIAYLHLVLLGIITAFLLVYLFANNYLHDDKLSMTGTLLFMTGIVLNEMVLALQGIASFSYLAIPHAQGALFTISLVMVGGLLLLTASQVKNAQN